MADDRSRPAVPRARDWRPHPTTAPIGRRGPSARGKKIFMALALMLALAGAVVGFLFYINPFGPPVFLSLPITEYTDHRLAPNAFAHQDGEALLRRFPGKGNGLAFNSQQGDVLRQQLRELKNHSERTFVFHVSSLAICREDKVYLLPADADLDRPQTWLPLDELLQAVAACPVTRKLLILDVMKPLADPRLGILYNPVAERVERAVRAMPGTPFWVLLACSPGQVSLASEDLHLSVFGYYLDRGLSGSADGALGDKKDDRVTVRELAAYTATQVDRWAQNHRATRQTPLLLGGGEDFELGSVEKGTTAAPEEATDTYPPLLSEAWAQADDWMKDGGLRAAPGVVRNLDAILLWAEQRWRGGFDFERIRENPALSLERLRQQVKQARPGQPPRSRSLLLAVTAAKQEPDDKTLDELKDLARQAEGVPKAKDPASAKQALDANAGTFLKKLDGKPLTLAEAAYRVALDDPQGEKVRFLAGLLGTGLPQYGETAQLRALAEIDPKMWPTAPATIRRLLRITRDRERANSCDPELLPWIMNRLCSVAALQHEGERLLFRGDTKVVEQADDRLAEAERALAGCQRALEQLQEAREMVDRALEFLPGDAAYLVSRPEVGGGDEHAWLDAARACGDLFDLLIVPEAPAKSDGLRAEDPFEARQDALRQTTETLRDRLSILSRPFDPGDVNQLIAQSSKPDAGASTLLQMQARLAAPCIKGQSRIDLWKGYRALGRRIQDHSDAAETDAQHPPPAVPTYGEGDRKHLETLERERAALRFHLSLGLLRLGGFGKTDLDADEEKLAQQPVAFDWDGTGDKLRALWGSQAPNQVQELVRRDAFHEADRLNRVIPPFQAAPSARSRENQQEPAAEVRRRQERRSWDWLGRHYRQEAENYLDKPAVAAFYRRASEEFFQFAR
jgi:hypothetical protein